MTDIKNDSIYNYSLFKHFIDPYFDTRTPNYKLICWSIYEVLT